MGRDDEQHQATSRGSSDERTDLYLDTNGNTDESISFLVEEKYFYNIGDKVSIDSRKFIIEDIGAFDIKLHDIDLPILSRVMNIVEFETKLKENPDNDYLKADNRKNSIKEVNEENYYGEFNDEIDLIDHILTSHKIDDIIMDFDEDGYIIANDEDGNVWKGLEFYTFLFDELFNYNEDGTVDLVDNKDLDKLKEYRKKYEIVENNEIELTEKENEDIEQAKKVISLFDSKKEQNNNSVSQLTLFAPKEQELADRIVDIFNSFDTKYKGTFMLMKLSWKNGNILNLKKEIYQY